jgi:DNA-cytosine methyltransferase
VEEITMSSAVAAVTVSNTNSQRNKDRAMPFLRRKQTGSFYTADDLTAVMMEELVWSLPIDKRRNLYNLRFLEPCVGEGSFVFAYIAAAQKIGFTKEQYRQLLDNIYVCDINEEALHSYRQTLSRLAVECFDVYLDDSYFTDHIGSSLLFDLESNAPTYIPIEDVFVNISANSFDIVATNPPYKNLKAERSHYPSDDEYNADKARYSAVTRQASQYLRYSVKGVNNIYKFFVEEITERYAKKDGIISLLIPSSILTDKTCEAIRKRIFTVASIKSIKIIGEESSAVDAQQALCAVLIHKAKKSKTIEICQNYGSPREKTIIVETAKAVDASLGYSILAIEPAENQRLQKLKSFPTIKETSFIVNMRGELDLTANKASIVSENTGYPLLRGRNIGFYQLRDVPSGDYVDRDFVDSSTKQSYIKCERLACQQIANMSKERRLTFSIVPSNTVLGNSCNFIVIRENEFGIDQYFMLGLLNSSIMNWYFKLQSSNNHINNYEIDTFPVPLHYEKKEEIANLVQEYIADKSRSLLLDKIDGLVCEAFGLLEKSEALPFPDLPDTTAFDKKVIASLTEKTERQRRGEVLNHITFKLSDLDLEMVRSVPQGGNWKNIPAKTVAKSQRLVQITQTGGRTTLYGRIDYKKPSYTITTYFNRPGNGTYIHPIHDRVLSVREAARFQTFPDSYFFCGNKTQLLNQVGNAVPPLFAYQLAKKIKDKTGCEKSLDLFCGAGGMSLGFKQAGIESALSTDIEQSACLTLKVNNPEISVFCGDITQNDVREKIVGEALQFDVDIICGGPPCQGFSMAGHRLSDDPRNQLFKDFIGIVEKVKPKVVVFENVEGLLTFQNGATYKLIHDMFSDIGYSTEGRLIQMQLFGVPQKRKRIIVICVRDDLNLEPCELFPLPITTNTESQITAHMAISDLEKVSCCDSTKYDDAEYSDFVALLKGETTQEEFLLKLSRKKTMLSITEPVQQTLFG